MYRSAFRWSSTAAVTTVTGVPASSRSMTSTPSGAASRQIAVTSSAPRLISSLIAATRVPPVANIGSTTYTWRPDRSSGIRVA